ncbi:MAG: AI-2E family transporter [Parcubacteria group bacterium]
MSHDNTQKLNITTSSWVRGVLVVTLAYVTYLLLDIVMVVVAAVVIASAIEPVAVWAGKKRVPRVPAVLFVYLAIGLILAGLFYFLLLPLLGEISSFIRTLTIYSNSVANGGVLSDLFRTQDIFGGLDTPVIIREISTQLNSFREFLSQGVFSSISFIFGGVLSSVLVLILSFYLVVQEDGISKFLKIITPVKHEDYVVGLWRRSQIKIGYWMQGQLLSSALVALLVYIALLIVGIPHALLLAVLAGIFELIPLFGATLAAIPALFVAYTFGGLTTLIIVAIIYIVIQQIEGNVIYPMVVKKVVGLPPTISILALVIGASLAGVLGALISVPVTAALMELISDYEESKHTDSLEKSSHL